MGTCTKYTKNMGTCLCIMPIDNSMGTCYDAITNTTTEQQRRVKTMRRKRTEDTNITSGKGKQRYTRCY